MALRSLPILSDTEAAEVAARLSQYEEWSLQFRQKNGWTVIPSEAVPPVSVTNEDRSRLECYQFTKERPEKYFLYINKAERAATTWTGERLGSVSFGREYRDNFGGRRISITVHAITGEVYSGTYFASSGDYARIRKLKSRSKPQRAA